MRTIVTLIMAGLLSFASATPGYSAHDNGNGKSQDANSAGNNSATGIGNGGNGGVAPGQGTTDTNDDGKVNGKDGAPGQNK
ncbi:hypothetical protein [Aurantimonas marianensis]|uniref:Uncharacterized protein n=1 Tax=Aurantimonas marianensis TaxID=2920428 RepID=A0A9X2H6N6_9HYPH|nr:hypothetical protein [Aurantimonas marianensis]MCP3054725.1 hypothetical protein [Aurantimonas marianensis]